MNKNLRLPVQVYLKLVEVFTTNGWEIQIEDAGTESRFNRFCERLSILDAKEQELVIELTKRFTVISGVEYLQLIIKLLNRINSENIEIFQKTSVFLVAPLIAPKDLRKTKSSKFMWYYFRDELVEYNPVFVGKKLIHCDVEKMSWAKTVKSDEIVILLDDYIGSGETAVSAIKWLTNGSAIDPRQIVVMSLAAQEMGMNHITQETGVVTYTYHRLTRGISDYYTGGQLEMNISTMNRIEDKLKIEKKFRFGYNKSEAMISLIRTPNNTFPVFWKSYRKNTRAPFSRD